MVSFAARRPRSADRMFDDVLGVFDNVDDHRVENAEAASILCAVEFVARLALEPQAGEQETFGGGRGLS